jgi:hypothetical protein
MTSLASPPLPAAPGPARLEPFFERVLASNPFLDNRVNGPSPEDVDVGSIHQAAFTRLTELAAEAHRQGRGVGAMLWGEAGIGKSHLLSRLARWAEEDQHACFVYLHNLCAGPETLPRSLLKAVISILTAGRASRLHTTELFQLVRAGLIEAVHGDLSRTYPWPELGRAWCELLDRLGAANPARAELLDRSVYDVLYRFFQSAHRLSQGKHDPGALAAVRWLGGDYLDDGEARELGLPSARGRETGIGLADNQQIKQALVALTQLARWRGQPFVLCFDQVDNLDREQMAALARFLEALLDSSPNLLVVIAGIQATLLRWRDERVIQDSAWDRLAQFTVSLQRVPVAEARQILAARLERFLQPSLDLDGVRERVREDPLFPLGSAWLDERLGDRIDLRPRDLINWACEAWQQEQARLRQQGGAAWLADTSPGPAPEPVAVLPPTAEEIRDAIDHEVEHKLAELREQRQRQPHTLPPDAGQMAGIVFKLLEQRRQVDPAFGQVAVERCTASASVRPPAYDLILRQQAESPRAERRTGLVFLVGTHGNATTAALRRLRDDRRPPECVLLISDERQPPRYGSRGTEYREELRRRGARRFRELVVTFAEYVELDALLRTVALAQAGDLEIPLPGQTRQVSAQEVMDAHQRHGRYQAAAVLREVLR